MRRARIVVPLAAYALLVSFFPSVASADEKDICVAASEKAQQLRDEGKYRSAREQMLTCSREVCPGLVRHDCAEWLEKLDNSAPTVVFGAKDAQGKDTANVKVFVDGQPLLDRLDSKPLTMDPGEHTFRYEMAGAQPIEDKVVIRVGEKNRALGVNFGSGSTAPLTSGSASPGGDHVNPTGEPSLVPALVIGGVGVVALGVFAVMGLSGKSQVSDLKSTCAPACNQSDVDSAKSKLLIADISLGVGLVAIGVATYLIVTRAPAPVTVNTALSSKPDVFRPRFDVRALPGGGVAEVGARF